GDVEVVRPSPHECAHHGLGEEETGGVASLDSGDVYVRSHADNAEPVGGRGNGAGRVGAVAVVVVCRHLTRYRSSAQAVDTVSAIHVLSKVRVADTPSIRLSVMRLPRNAVLSELAITTPIWG